LKHTSAIFRATKTAALAGLIVVCAGCSLFPKGETTRAREEAQAAMESAESALQEGRSEEALRLFELAIAENPELTAAHLGAAEIHREQGDYLAAERAYERAAEIEPSSFDAQFGHGLTLQLLDRLAEAVRAYLRALRIRPDDYEANRNLAAAYLELGEPREALPYARRAAEHPADEGPGRVNLGAVYAALDRHNQAVLEYQAAAEEMELTPELLLNLADSLGKAGRRREMVATLERLIRMEPSAPAYERLGYALFKLREYDGALQAFQEAVALDPTHYPALNGVGVCQLNKYLLSGRRDPAERAAAIQALRQSLRINRDQPRIIDLLNRYG